MKILRYFKKKIRKIYVYFYVSIYKRIFLFRLRWKLQNRELTRHQLSLFASHEEDGTREVCLKGALGVMGRSKTSSQHPRLRLRDDLRPVRAVKKRNISRMTPFYKEKDNQFWENSSNIFLSNQMHQCNLILSTCVDFPNYSLGHAREHSRHCFYWRLVYITKNRTKGHKYHSLVPSPFHKLF